jgi:hypothetical protein
MAQGIDLAGLFSAAAKALIRNRDALNRSDTRNHNHGDNMVEAFEIIARALKDRQGASSAEQLEHAARWLRRKTRSGSGQAYASGLERAAQAFAGQSVTKENAGTLLQSLFGAPQRVSPPAAGASSLSAPAVPAPAGGGPTAARGAADESDVGDLFHAGLSRLRAGRGGLEALIGAAVNASVIGREGRAESGLLVANALITALGKPK